MIPRGKRDLNPTDHDMRPDPRLIADLQRVYRRSTPLDTVDDTIRHAVEVRVTHGDATERRPRRRHVLSGLRVPIAALTVLALGVGTYLHGQGPTPVSAQTVLHRAAAASPGPDESIHATYLLSSKDGSTGSADIWIGYDGSGTASELALSLSLPQTSHPASHPNAGVVAVGPGLAHLYDPNTKQVPDPAQSNAQQVPPPTARVSVLAQTMKGIVVGTLLAQELSAQPTDYTLGQETLDGVSVYVLQRADAPGVTYYFNAQTYVLQGADWLQAGTTWQVRLVSSDVVPLSMVPPRTFGSGTDGTVPAQKP